MFLVVCPVPSTFPIGQSRFHIDCQFDYELEIARIELHLKLKLCARASFFFNNLKILKDKKPLMFFFQSSQKFNYHLHQKVSGNFLKTKKTRCHFVDNLRELHSNRCQYHPASGLMQILHFDQLRYQRTINNSHQVAKFFLANFIIAFSVRLQSDPSPSRARV